MMYRYCMALLTALALGLPCPGVAQDTAPGATDAAPLAPWQLEDALAVVLVPNVPATVDQVGALAARFDPHLNRDMLRAMAGDGFQDPTLSGLGAQGAMAIVVLPPANVLLGAPVLVGMIEVAADHQEAYQAGLRDAGLASEPLDGWLALGQNASHVTASKALLEQVRARYLTGDRPAELAAHVHLKTIFDRWGPQIDGLLQTLPLLMAMGQMNNPMAQGMSPQAIQTQTQILVGELRVLNSLARQIETLRLSLRFPDSGILLTKTATLIQNTNLAAFNQATAEPARDLMGLLPADSPIRAFAAYNAEAYASLITLEGRKVLQEMNIARDTADALLAIMTKGAELYGDGMALEMAFDGKPISGTMIARLESDSDETLATFESTFEQVEKSGMLEFYEQMGMPMTMEFKKNVRSHQDVAIHALDMAIEVDENAPPGMQAMMELMGAFKYEVAMVDGYLIYAFGDREIDSLIDRVQGGPTEAEARPLTAEKVLAPGGHWYADVNLGSMVGFAALSAQTAMAAQPIAPGDQTQVLKTFDEIRQAFENADPIAMRGAGEGLTMTCEILAPQSLVDRMAGVYLNIREVATSAPPSAPVPVAPDAPPAVQE